MSQGWYVETGGKVEGPLSTRELRDRVASGRLRPTDRVSADGTTWVAASQVQGLAFSDTVAPPAPTLAIPPEDVPRVPAATDSLAETVEGRIHQIPGYEIVGVLGKGACGVVYRARQVRLDRIVALKMVLSDQPTSAATRARFDKEAVALAKLKHPNIVGVYDCGHHDGQAYFAMELLEGEDLARRIGRGGPLGEAVAWHIARQTASALAHAAESGVFHRDVKPSNLFLTPPPTGFPLPPGVPLVKVTDFGIAFTRDAAADSRLTATGVVLGTPTYMPPEQFTASDVDHRADIYALGATVYHALTGELPFPGENIWEVMLKKTDPVPRLGPRASHESCELVAAMMARRAEDRVGTYRELLARIDSLPCPRPVTHTTPPPAPPTPPPPSTRRRVRPYLLALLGVLVIAGAVALGLHFFGKPREYVTGAREELFDGQSLLGWVPVGGSRWVVENDEEPAPVLTGTGGLRRQLRPLPNFRVVLGLHLHKADAADVVVAAADGPVASARRLVVRVTPTTAALGWRDGERGEFRPLAAGVPVPTPTQLEDEERRPYIEVRYERAGDKFRAWYHNQPLGEATDGKMKSAEILVVVEGGPVRIDTAAVEELIEKR